MSFDVIELATEIAEVFDSLEVPYLIGGSLAAISWSVPRFTLDVDVVADLEDRHVPPLLDTIADRWYVEEAMIREAIAQRTSFNAVRFRGMIRIDVFVPPDEDFHRSKWSRARHAVLDPESDRELAITSPEDIVLQKLDWYRQGDQVSEQQWIDVTTLLRVQGEQLDHEYLDDWAERLELGDLLKRARAEG